MKETHEKKSDQDDTIHRSRQYVIDRIFKALQKDPELAKSSQSITSTKLSKLAQDIESGIYEFVKEIAEEKALPCDWNRAFVQMYCNKAVSIYSNLDPENHVKNPRFRTRILHGEFQPNQVARLLPYDIFPEKWKTLLDEKFKIDKNLYETRTEAATDIYKCGKCHKRVCTYFQLQTRSADEPMTTFVTCLNCGNRWKH